MRKSFFLLLPAIGAALIAVLAQITLPLGPVPFSLQNLAIGLIATIFYRREAVLTAILYLLLGALGLPVFAGGGAGFQALLGPNAGYLWFYLLYAATTSSLTKPDSKIGTIFLANLLGDSLVFVGGVLGLQLLAGMTLSQALAVGVTPFLLPDLGKILVISLVSPAIFKSLKGQAYFAQEKN